MMKAAIMSAAGSIACMDVETPTPGPGEVVIKVAATGVCAGDLYLYLGKHPYECYPVVGGHEISGIISEVGESVSLVKPGEAVVVEPFLKCGKCYPCRNGKSNCCVNFRMIGLHEPGGFAEYVRAPADRLHPIPDGLSLTQASLAEPVAIGVQACRRGQVKPGELVVVLGCGPIGLTIIEVVRSLGARAIATDISEGRLAVARELGAETLLADEHTIDRVLELTSGEGAPVVIEATGNPRAMEQTVSLVASGGRIVVVGLVRQGVGVTLPGLELTRKEMTIVGSRASVDCFPESLQLLAEGAIHLSNAAQTFPLDQAPRVFSDLAAEPTALSKAIFVLDEL